MYRDKTVSIVFPAFNEEQGITQAVKEFRAVEAIDKVYVVNNNSKDRTASLAREAGAIVIDEPRQGYGNALRRGLSEADTDYIVLCEPDGTFMAQDVYKLLSYAHQFEMVMGTRTTRELIWQAANMTWFLRWGNYAVGKSLQMLFNGPSLSDCGCTFRLVRRELAAEMNPVLSVGASHFLPEMVILALLMGAPIIEIPLNYRGRVGESKITGSLGGTLRTGTMMMVTILRYKLKQLGGFRKRLRFARSTDGPRTF
jgi:glycosyltransferase involved in cell wall biosynthesis